MKRLILLILTLLVFLISRIIASNTYSSMIATQNFNGLKALANAAHQVNFGPRIYNSYAHYQVINWISSELLLNNWFVQIEVDDYKDRIIKNIIAKSSPYPPDIIIGAHYDSRIKSDRELDLLKQSFPTPGANDGASGTAVLLELSRIINRSGISIWLVFFDAEDDGNIKNYDWEMGSRKFVSNLEIFPSAVIIVDMVGDRNLDIYREVNSNKTLNESLWQEAASLGYSDYFINSGKYSMLDDHTPFLEMGIPAALIIDFDYEYWHTNSDTLDKLSAQSLEIVGTTILSWLESKYE